MLLLLQFSEFGLKERTRLDKVGEGLFLSTSSTYAVEIAPARHRGRLGSASQFGSIVGLVIGYFSVYGTVNIEGDLAFQIPFMIQVIIPLQRSILAV